MRRLLICISILSFIVAPKVILAADEDDLKAANLKLFHAWDSLDAETLASLISQGAVGYNPDAAFPIVGPMKSTQAERTEYLTTYLQNMERVFMNPYNIQGRVFGNTGILWGHVTVSVKQKGEPGQTWYLRYTSTWIKSDGQWHIIMNHYSAIPSGRWVPWFEQNFSAVN